MYDRQRSCPGLQTGHASPFGMQLMLKVLDCCSGLASAVKLAPHELDGRGPFSILRVSSFAPSSMGKLYSALYSRGLVGIRSRDDCRQAWS